jgi:hypothetical protein
MNLNGPLLKPHRNPYLVGLQAEAEAEPMFQSWGDGDDAPATSAQAAVADATDTASNSSRLLHPTVRLRSRFARPPLLLSSGGT